MSAEGDEAPQLTGDDSRSNGSLGVPPSLESAPSSPRNDNGASASPGEPETAERREQVDAPQLESSSSNQESTESVPAPELTFAATQSDDAAASEIVVTATETPIVATAVKAAPVASSPAVEVSEATPADTTEAKSDSAAAPDATSTSEDNESTAPALFASTEYVQESAPEQVVIADASAAVASFDQEYDAFLISVASASVNLGQLQYTNENAANGRIWNTSVRVQLLLSALANDTVKELSLSNCDLSTDAIKSVALRLETSRNLVSLSISQPVLEGEALSSIATLLRFNQIIQVVSLTATNSGADTLQGERDLAYAISASGSLVSFSLALASSSWSLDLLSAWLAAIDRKSPLQALTIVLPPGAVNDARPFLTDAAVDRVLGFINLVGKQRGSYKLETFNLSGFPFPSKFNLDDAWKKRYSEADLDSEEKRLRALRGPPPPLSSLISASDNEEKRLRAIRGAPPSIEEFDRIVAENKKKASEKQASEEKAAGA